MNNKKIEDLGDKVSQKEYQALLKKYNSLQEEVKNLRLYEKESLQNTNSSSETEMVQTVDVFGEQEPKSSRKVVSVSSQQLSPVASEKINFVREMSDNDAKAFEASLYKLRKVRRKMRENDYGEAMSILKDLQRSPYRQIQVRAQFLVGESFFKQGEFDLALQSYEDIIQRSAFSGFVLKALRKLVVCAEKLGIDDKRDQYYSMLHDFFEGA